MKQYIPTITSVISCVLVLLCLLRISALEDRLYSVQNNMTNQYNVLRNDIQSISSNVLSSIEEGNNLLTSGSYTLENANVKGGTVDLNCVVTLKELEPDGTTAVLTCNGKEYPMNLKNGDFVAKFPISIFNNSEVTEVAFTKDGVVRTQALDWYIDPRGQFVPSLYANISGTSTGSISGANTYRWHKTGDLHISVEQKGGLDSEVKTLHLVQTINGEEAQRINILKEERKDAVVFGGQPAGTILNRDPLEIQYSINHDFECPFGSEMILYVEMSDESGLIHCAIVDQIVVDENGKLDDDRIPTWHGDAGNIYDAEGNLLCGTDWGEEAVYWNY